VNPDQRNMGAHGARLRQRGQGIVEYGLILGMTALVTIASLVFFGGALAAALSLIGAAIESSS
jgi:Flp pilus assembly pilin Flp